MLEKLKKEGGSVTIEATISLSAFMFAIVTILTIVNIYIVQTKISMAINATAKELSHYSYLYSLTGINNSVAKLSKSAEDKKTSINDFANDANTVFTEIQNLGKSDASSSGDIGKMISGLGESYKTLKEGGTGIQDTLESLAENPKDVAFGILQIAAVDGLNFAMSKLVAAPLSRTLCKKNLVAERGGDVESYLKSLGVKPGTGGSYMKGLDFSDSTLFADNSNEIRVNVTYEVKVIALLPINFTFKFNQTAVTQGWLAGDETYQSTKSRLEKKYKGNNSIWNSASPTERAELIRHQGISDLEDDGYKQVCGGSYSDIHMYNEEANKFVGIHSMNPLYGGSTDSPLTLDDINEDVVRGQIEYICAGISDTVGSLSTVSVKTKGTDGSTKKESHDCSGATGKVVLVIPEDPGLKEKMESIIKSANTRGIDVEIITGYGNGASATEIPQEGEQG